VTRNAVRILISLFILVLIVVAFAGWIWTSHHQPAAQSQPSHLVLGMSVLAGLGGLAAIWRSRALK
jgi:hypothetical protein